MVTIVRRIVVLLYLYAISLASGSHLHHVVVGEADIDKLVALEAHLQLSHILALGLSGIFYQLVIAVDEAFSLHGYFRSLLDDAVDDVSHAIDVLLHVQ